MVIMKCSLLYLLLFVWVSILYIQDIVQMSVTYRMSGLSEHIHEACWLHLTEQCRWSQDHSHWSSPWRQVFKAMVFPLLGWALCLLPHLPAPGDAGWYLNGSTTRTMKLYKALQQVETLCLQAWPWQQGLWLGCVRLALSPKTVQDCK